MADRNIDISVIIPFYDEKGNVEEIITRTNDILSGLSFEIIAVNDGSRDNTLECIKRAAEKFPAVRIIDFTRNFGQSAAFQAGFDNARGRYIVTIDGDNQNDPADIPLMIDKLEKNNADMIVGWRKKRKDSLFAKKIPSGIANRIISSFLNLKIHDTGCSLKVFKSSILPEIRLYGEMHRFIPYLAHARGATVIEMPVSHRERRSSYSKYGLSRTLKVFLDMMTVKFLNEFSSSPIYAIGGLSVYTGLLSLISFIALLIMKIFYGIDMTGNPLLIISVFLGIIALQIFMLGLMSEIQVRAYFEASGREIYKIRAIIESSGEDE